MKKGVLVALFFLLALLMSVASVNAEPVVNVSINNTSPSINDIINISANATDDIGLVYVNITYNMSGILRHANYSVSGTTASVWNDTQITSIGGSVINFTVYATDTSNNVKQNSTLITVADTPSTFPANSKNDANTTKGESLTFSINVSDADIIQNIIFAWNGSGNFTNVSSTSILNSPTSNSSFTQIVNNISGTVIGYQFIANDTTNVQTQSPIFTFIVSDTPSVFTGNSTNSSGARKSQLVNFSVSVSDVDYISTIYFAWDCTPTGSFVNVSNITFPALSVSSAELTVNQTILNNSRTACGWVFTVNDSAGTQSQTGIQTFIVANTAPPPTSIFNISNKNVSTNVTLNITEVTDSDNETVRYIVLFEAVNPPTVVIANQTTLNFITNMTNDTTYFIRVDTTDLTDMMNGSSIFNITLDTTLPAISELNSNDTDDIARNDIVMNFTVNASDIHLLNVALNGTLMNPVGGNQFRLSSDAITLGCTLEGPCLLNAVALDFAGNTNSINYSLTIDNNPPILLNLRAKNDIDNITRSDNVINFTINISDANFRNVTLNSLEMTNGTEEYYLVAKPSDLGCTIGNCTLTAVVTDKADNINAASYYTIVDDLNPLISLLAPQNNANVSGTISITVSVTDLTANISSVAAINGTAIFPMSLLSGTDGNGVYNLTIDTRQFQSGIANFRFNATDKAGNYNETLELNLTIDNMNPKILAFNGIV
ncbi:hypothetical protein HYX09_02775, partial [Candidatus Woesearchaeota archaeon]|nr:hypothetical protein [Candidatus Woesearchaeota archaeon]